ncbi:polyphosphate kinase [Helicobacter mustelae 12198]|uniref:Polyphosphate kinase n=1 Tax=Helicobacter mustelae (strain ATCC 43772 / CCUG 25715 / CIP 103759 / LMG 18044 / NCTC 12198 / R85-136P) TaxID=679897 RepID=D3UG82_HELM1|nr:polyphosphate kinase [Helicobacter mustelae 12198]
MPLLERLKFLAIYGTNLDEFYMIRIAGLKHLYTDGVFRVGDDGLSVKEQLHTINQYLRAQKKELEELYEEIIFALREKGLHIYSFHELSDDLQKTAREYFHKYLYPIVTPIVMDAKNPLPSIHGLNVNIAVELIDQRDDQTVFGIVRIPQSSKRFISLGKDIFVNIESIIAACAQELFKGFKVQKTHFFRITRNADIEIQEQEADDFIALMNEGLKERKKGKVVRLELGGDQEDLLLKTFIQNQVDLQESDTFSYKILLNVGALWEIVNKKEFAHLLLPSFAPKVLAPLHAKECMFKLINKQDVILFHPYESFDPVANFIHQASIDPSVVSIRMTLYRVGKDSPIVEALIHAAESKQVTVLVELKARFDEENNLHWARALEKAGAHVMYGVPHLKVHAKLALVIRQEGNKLRGYVHLSSGNYNPITAKIYSDISYFSANPKITEDAIALFHSLSTGTAHKTSLEYLKIAPTQIKNQILALIEKEMSYKKEGKIILKANALVDSEVIAKLYEASNAGVQIFLIIRGICCLVPHVPGMSENIKVISLVGKYLEHARIYYFAHEEPIYFSSADLMPRNLERRIEILVPIFQKSLYQKILDILLIQLRDDVNTYELQSSGHYFSRAKSEGIDSQLLYEEYVQKLFLDYHNAY